LLEFHGLGSLLLELTGDNDFATLSTILDNWLNNVVSSQSKRDVLEELVVHGFNLSRSAETLVLDGVSENLDLIIRVSESLLEELSEFLVFLSLNTNNLLGLSWLDSDFSLDRGSSDFNTSVTSILESLGEERMELSVEDTICHEFLLLVDLLGSLIHFDFFFW